MALDAGDELVPAAGTDNKEHSVEQRNEQRVLFLRVRHTLLVKSLAQRDKPVGEQNAGKTT